ncbi:hypothetical protein ASAP_2002 [Asaia bogorensis]|uniref:Uncharacterized protein n=1 Tax=Asaia bogorensis TaxID=91915 RepID=A0A060QL62_9PROT|nr:hypothetical protein ASAP_2002 [Asaia bogorensis]
MTGRGTLEGDADMSSLLQFCAHDAAFCVLCELSPGGFTPFSG